MPRKSTPQSLLALAVMLGAVAGSARAQNALGDGRALDANPGQYGQANPRSPNIMDEIRFRNSIATGNAPGGLSFRGDVGYRAPGEFTGQLGSDSLFAFRRDSLYSGLAGMGLRGTDALQYQFSLTTGATPPRNLIGDLSFTRGDQYSTSAPSNQMPGARDNRAVGQDRTIGYDREVEDLDMRGRALSVPSYDITGFDGGGSMLGTLRSPSTYTTTATLQPSLMSVYEQGVDRRPYGVIASPLLGVTSMPLPDEEDPANPLVARPGENRTGLDQRRGGAGYEPARIRTSYDDMVQEMRQRVDTMRETRAGDTSISTDPTMTTDQWLIQQMEDLRQKLYGNKPANEGRQEEDEQGPDATDPAQQDPGQATRPGEDDRQRDDQEQPGSEMSPLISLPGREDSPLEKSIEERRKRLGQMDQEGIQLYDPTEIAIDPETREVLRGSASNEVEQLLDPGAEDRDVYAEHIKAGERMITAGRFFDAEERFTHALSIRPGDVTAQIGRMHAQIGAGMLLSASVNMQSLFSAHPEMITTKYSDKLLPAPERIELLLERLRERSGIERTEQSARPLENDRIRVAAALLLSYLGYQSENPEAIEQGLQLVAEQGADSDRRFASLLRQLWLQDTAEQGDSRESDAGD